MNDQPSQETSARGSHLTAPESRVAPSDSTTSGQPIECCPTCNAEVGRLRAALEEIASGDIVICKPLQQMARDALKQPSTGADT